MHPHTHKPRSKGTPHAFDTHTYTHIHTHKHTHTHTSTSSYTRQHTQAQVNWYAPRITHTYTHTLHTNPGQVVCPSHHTYTHAHARAHTHTHTHFTQTQVKWYAPRIRHLVLDIELRPTVSALFYASAHPFWTLSSGLR